MDVIRFEAAFHPALLFLIIHSAFGGATFSS
jgi:hypothetical protein